VQLRAVEALGRLGSLDLDQTLPVLLDLALNRNPGGYSNTLRGEALLALGSLDAAGSKTTMPILNDLILDRNPGGFDLDLRAKAVEALGRMKVSGQPTGKFLLQLAEGSTMPAYPEPMRVAAVKALAGLGGHEKELRRLADDQAGLFPPAVRQAALEIVGLPPGPKY
jgi:HEAT repeat protein